MAVDRKSETMWWIPLHPANRYIPCRAITNERTSQNWQKALDDLGRSIETRETAQAFSLRGRVHACMRRWDDALADYNAALALDPSNAAALEGRAEALTPYVPLPMMSDEDAARMAAGK